MNVNNRGTEKIIGWLISPMLGRLTLGINIIPYFSIGYVAMRDTIITTDQ